MAPHPGVFVYFMLHQECVFLSLALVIYLFFKFYFPIQNIIRYLLSFRSQHQLVWSRQSCKTKHQSDSSEAIFQPVWSVCIRIMFLGCPQSALSSPGRQSRTSVSSPWGCPFPPMRWRTAFPLSAAGLPAPYLPASFRCWGHGP